MSQLSRDKTLRRPEESGKRNKLKTRWIEGLVVALLLAVSFYLYSYQSSLLTLTQEHLCDNQTEISVSKLNVEKIPSSLDFWFLSNLRSAPIKLDIETGEFIFPKEIRRVWVDVGVHRRSNFLDHIDTNPDLFILGFEPVNYVPCDHSRCFVFWAAATPKHQIITMNIQGAGGLCDSFLQPNDKTTSKVFQGCVKNKGTFNAPGIPLHEVLSRIPKNIEIEHLKIDAQGFDYQVMTGALPVSDRIRTVSLECQDVDNPGLLLYTGALTCFQIRKNLEQHGMHYQMTVKNNPAVKEMNVFFVHDPDDLSNGFVNSTTFPVYKDSDIINRVYSSSTHN